MYEKGSALTKKNDVVINGSISNKKLVDTELFL